MPRSAVLEQVTLAGQMGECAPLDAFPVGILPNLSVDQLWASRLGPEHVECMVEYGFEYATPRDRRLVCEVAATFRLVYRMRPPRSLDAERRWCSTRAVRDAWPYWRSYLIQTSVQMGLHPVMLPPDPPDELQEDAELAFDVTREQRAKTESGKRPRPPPASARSPD